MRLELELFKLSDRTMQQPAGTFRQPGKADIISNTVYRTKEVTDANGKSYQTKRNSTPLHSTLL